MEIQDIEFKVIRKRKDFASETDENQQIQLATRKPRVSNLKWDTINKLGQLNGGIENIVEFKSRNQDSKVETSAAAINQAEENRADKGGAVEQAVKNVNSSVTLEKKSGTGSKNIHGILKNKGSSNNTNNNNSNIKRKSEIENEIVERNSKDTKRINNTNQLYVEERKENSEREREAANRRRKSSLGTRGMRASQIGNGYVAMPHASVSPGMYYRHISSSLPEPHRLKILLYWAINRADPPKLSRSLVSTNTKLAHQLQRCMDSMVKDIGWSIQHGGMNTSWYNRKDPADSQRAEAARHPTNTFNSFRKNVLMEQIVALRSEEQTWSKVANSVTHTSEGLTHRPPSSSSSSSSAAFSFDAFVKSRGFSSYSDFCSSINSIAENTERFVAKHNSIATTSAAQLAAAVSSYNHASMTLRTLLSPKRSPADPRDLLVNLSRSLAMPSKTPA